MFWFFSLKAYGILGPRQGIKAIPPVLVGGFLTTGAPGKSLCHFLSSGYLFGICHFSITWLQHHEAVFSGNKKCLHPWVLKCFLYVVF